MDELNEKLSEILGDPESMEKVRQMAESMFGSESQGDSAQADTDTARQIMSVVSALKNTGDDDRTALLLALKPHLNEDRQKKVDRAVKLLKLIEILPVIRENGLLDL